MYPQWAHRGYHSSVVEPWPEANIGVVTGRESGLIVLDIDSPRGEESIEGYNIPDTAEQLMGRGRQLLFQRHDGDFELKSATDLRQWQRSAPQRI